MKLMEMAQTMSFRNSVLEELYDFLDEEEQLEISKEYEKKSFVGYVLELGYDYAKIITSDNYKLIVGGIPRGSFLIMVPDNYKEAEQHFTLIRVKSVSSTPLSNQVQQTYFELHKRSMPEIDVWTMAELQWGALDCDVLGMYYVNPTDMKLNFSGDVNNVVSPHRYKVYYPNEKLLNLIVNGLLQGNSLADIGTLRTMECKLGSQLYIKTWIDVDKFKGFRTAMFGKTRLGKSNVVKLIIKSIIDKQKENEKIGQLIFDINGEYANDNDQDGKSIRSIYENRVHVYALKKREQTPSKPLKINFYENPSTSIALFNSFLEKDKKTSNYIKNFASAELPSIKEYEEATYDNKTRFQRKLQIFWIIIHKAGFLIDVQKLRKIGLGNNKTLEVNFNSKIKDLIKYDNKRIENLDQLHGIYEKVYTCYKNAKDNEAFKSSSGKPYFDSNDIALLDFLFTTTGSGTSILAPYKKYHDENSEDFIKDIIGLLDDGKTVILDLGNATDEIRSYFSDMISISIFEHQEEKFTSSNLKNDYVQLYFEEAHNLFPYGDKELKNVYAKFAKEGAKFHIGMVYSTQSPSTISKELLAQTENFFVGHLSSQDEVNSLARTQIAFEGVKEDILKSKTPGFMRMLTHSHRFVIPFQAYLFKNLGEESTDGI